MATVAFKGCSRCKQILPADAFRPTPKIKCGLDSSCRSCLAASRRAKRNEDIEAFRAWQRAYYAKNADRCREMARDYYVKDKEIKNARSKAHYRANRAKYIALAKDYCAKNPERTRQIARAISGRRRSIKRSGVKPALQLAWVKTQKKVCHWCGKGCAKRYEIDHITPLSKGGPHELKNLCIACPDCNRRKSARDPIEWAQMIGKLL